MRHYLKNLEDTVRQHWTQKALCDYNGDSFTYAQLAINVERFRCCPTFILTRFPPSPTILTAFCSLLTMTSGQK